VSNKQIALNQAPYLRRQEGRKGSRQKGQQIQITSVDVKYLDYLFPGFAHHIMSEEKLKIPATSWGKSPTVKENFIFIRSLNPLQAAGLVLAVQFKGECEQNPDDPYIKEAPGSRYGEKGNHNQCDTKNKKRK
jgi:hypothetical protein